MTNLNREGWLTELARQVEPLFKGFTLKPYRLTCGWPCKNALGRRTRRVGECHGLESSAGGFHEIFISPLIDRPLEVAGTVCHEMAHVVAGIDAGHKGEFLKVCKHVGLNKGRPLSVMPGKMLEERIQKMIDGIGTYPHHALNPKGKLKPARIVAFSLCCPGCGCVVRISAEWMEKAGPTTCGCGLLMEIKNASLKAEGD